MTYKPYSLRLSRLVYIENYKQGLIYGILGALRPGLSKLYVIESLSYDWESDSILRESDSKYIKEDSTRTKVLYK